MTHDEFLSTLKTLGWTVRGLARILGRPEGTVTNWRKPEYSVPADVAAWLRRRLRAHQRMMEDDPPPAAP
jgi:plasmid maintenance system antidote protein VapI